MTRTRGNAATTVLLVALAGAVLLAGCGQQGESETAEAEVFPVETSIVSVGRIAPTLTYSGTVKPWRKALLGAQIQGPVERIHVEAGDRVTRGELLVELASEQLTQASARYGAVEKDWQERGIGSDLVRRVLVLACNRAIKRVHAICLADMNGVAGVAIWIVAFAGVGEKFAAARR